MGRKGIFVVSAELAEGGAKGSEGFEKKEVDLEEALSIVGVGWCNLRYCMLYAGFLIAVITESFGYSYLLPAARCDFNISDSQRGFISSLPYIAVVVSSHAWGYLADTRGRRPTLLMSSLTVGVLGAAACFMPNLISFAVCKFIASLFLACPAGISYTLIGEILPRQYRDTALSVVNASQILGSSVIPMMAWWILSYDWSVEAGAYSVRPWRLLGVLYSMPMVLCGLCLLRVPESPKYLVAAGRREQALRVLRDMYVGNTGRTADQFPVFAIKSPPQTAVNAEEKKSAMESLKQQTIPLFRPPYLKWLVLNSVLLFGVFSTLNGLFMWVPDVLNRVLSGDAGEGMTACQVIGARLNESAVAELECDDRIAVSTYQINAVSNTVAAVISIIASVTVKVIGKKTLIIAVFAVTGVFCVCINFTTQNLLFAGLLSSLQLTAICIGPINAYSVGIFPTELRGMAVGLTIMFGRLGSVLNANVAGLLINAACEVTFYSFGGTLLVCALLSILLPRSQQ